MKKLLIKLFGHRYYFIPALNGGDDIEVRVDVFGQAQYRKYHPYGYIAGGDNHVWMNLVERNPKSDWVKKYGVGK